jgi:hypothetical protein
VVYKVDRLTRSLADFAKLVELFDQHSVSFVSVTQSFNTTSSMGRLTLNVLLSFAQFEREVIGERVRDKIAASGTAWGGPRFFGLRSANSSFRASPPRRNPRLTPTVRPRSHGAAVDRPAGDRGRDRHQGAQHRLPCRGIGPGWNPDRGSADHDLDHRCTAWACRRDRHVRARQGCVHDHRRKG